MILMIHNRLLNH